MTSAIASAVDDALTEFGVVIRELPIEPKRIVESTGECDMKFVKNAWYVAAESHEVADGLIGRTICDRPVVLFRTNTVRRRP